MAENQQQYEVAETGIFWDTEDCKIPKGLTASEVLQNIKSALATKGLNGPISVKTYSSNDGFSFRSTGIISRGHFAAGKKVTREKKMLIDLADVVFENRLKPKPTNVLLITQDISEDRAFINMLKLLRSEKHNVLLAQSRDKTSKKLIWNVSTIWVWRMLASGGRELEEEEEEESSSRFRLGAGGGLLVAMAASVFVFLLRR